MAVHIGIQMKWKELTKTFMMISSWKKHLWIPWFIHKHFSVERVNKAKPVITTQDVTLVAYRMVIITPQDVSHGGPYNLRTNQLFFSLLKRNIIVS